MAISMGRIAASVRKRFVDSLQRTSTGIGTASDGSIWTQVRSSFNISNGTATVGNSAGDYPIAIQDMPYQNVNVLVKSPSNGAGTAFWVTDSGNWWAVATEQTSVSCNCTNYSYCNGTGCTSYGCTGYGCTSSACSGYSCSAYGCNSYGCTGYTCGGYTCVAYGCTASGCTASGCTSYGCVYYAGSYCVAYGCKATGCTGYGCTGYGCTASACSYSYCSATGCNGYGCTGYSCSGYSCNGYGCTSSGCTGYGCTSYATGTTCETCYPRSIRVLQSVSGTVSAIYSAGISALANALRLKTTGNQIEVTAYSDTSATAQIDSPIAYTATGSTQTKKYGLVISPATYGQGTTVGDIEINPN